MSTIGAKKSGFLRKQATAIVLTVSLLLSCVHTAFAAESASRVQAAAAPDISGHWAERQLGEWLQTGLLQGFSDGKVRPDRTITRAELAALVNRIFGFTELAPDGFASDLNKRDWSYRELAAAVKAGYLQGDGDGAIGAARVVTRQEAAVVIARLLPPELASNAAAAEVFTDAGQMSAWSKGAIGALAAGKMMVGFKDGSFKPDKQLTRAEMIVLLDRIVTGIGLSYNKAGTYGPMTGTLAVKGKVSINATGVTLRNMNVAGDLIVSEGVGEGDATLNKVTVKGTTTIAGGGPNSIHLQDVALNIVQVDKKSGAVRVVLGGTTNVLELIVSDKAKGTVIVLENGTRIATLRLNEVIKALGLGTIGKVIYGEKGKGSSFETRPDAEEGMGSNNPVYVSGPVETPQPEVSGYVQDQFFLSTFRAVNFEVPRPENPNKTVYTKAIAASKEAGLNLIDNAIMSRKEMLTVLEVCDEQQIRCLAHNLTEENGFTGVGDYYPEFTAASIESVVDELSQFEMLEGYYVWDEVSIPEFGVLNELNDYFDDYDPGRLTYSITLPSYGQYTWNNNAYADYIDAYVQTVDPDVLGFDYYPFSTPNVSLINNDLWRDMGLFRKKAMETNKPFWFYFQGVDLATGDTGGWMNRERIGVQMYAALAYGAKTLSYYNALGLITDASGNKTAMFDDIKSLNGEVLNLGNFLFDKKSKQMYHFGILPQNHALYDLDSIEASDLIASAPDNSIVSVFTDQTPNPGGDKVYVLVVNKDYNNPMTGNLKLKYYSEVDYYNKTDDTTQNVANSTASIALNIPSGDAALFIIEPSNEPAPVETPEEPANVVDSFDLYTENENTGYVVVDGLANATFSLDSGNAKTGTCAGKIDYTYSPGGAVYTGITKDIAKNIAGYGALQLWVKTTALTNQDPFRFSVRLTDENGNMWYGTTAVTSAAHNNYVLVEIPFDTFTNGSGTVYYDPSVNSTQMNNIAISYIVSGFEENMTLWLDQIMLSVEPANVVDSFDLYTENGNTGYVVVDGLANATFSLDSANAKAGMYAGRIDYTYAPGGAVYTGITKDIAKNMGGYSALQLWVKTTALTNQDPFRFSVRLTDENGNMWYGITAVTSAAHNNYVQLEIPFDTFTNGSGTVYYNPSVHSTQMRNIAISYIVSGFEQNMSLWLDQITLKE